MGRITAIVLKRNNLSQNGEKELVESYILSDFYLVRDFTDAELRLLIDSLLFSKHIPHNQCKRLIEKIEYGLRTSNNASAKKSIVILSARSINILESIIASIIIAARVTLGVKPTNAA